MNKKEFMTDLKSIYTADTKKIAENNLAKLSENGKISFSGQFLE